MSYKSYRADLNGFELISFVSSILWVFVFRKYTHGLLALICVCLKQVLLFLLCCFFPAQR